MPLVLLALACSSVHTQAFSLLCKNCEDCPPSLYSPQPDDIGVAANLGEEYRWNVPLLVYAFDAKFLNYFGNAGVTAVEAAISSLNELPPASQINPSNFPPNVTQLNPVAQSLGLVDLKSLTLALLLEQFGLAQPTRHIFDLHDWNETLLPPNDEASWPPGTIPGLILQRNFDPFTFVPSQSVNDTLYTGYVVTRGPFDPTPAFGEALEFPVDPMAPTFNAVADRALKPGMIYAGLTRDDVAGLRYLLQTNNLNFETMLPDVHGIGTNAGNYVQTALRPGIDKITLIRGDLDVFLGRLLAPITNRFTDRFYTNSELRQQWVERVITQPDLLFTASAPEVGPRPELVYLRTGTSNWWNSASVSGLPGIVGPGVIRPPVSISFKKFTPRIFTDDDSAEGAPDLAEYGWGAFDTSTNPPVSMPAGFVPGNQPFAITLRVRPETDAAATLEHTWELPVAVGTPVALELSSYLENWVQVAIITNAGRAVEWEHTRKHDQKFFRVSPY